MVGESGASRTDVFDGKVISDFIHKVSVSASPDVLHDRLKALEKRLCFLI